jgi:hypothetical protein
MTRDGDRPANGPAGSATLDDEPIARLVRAVADDWRMPPQRLDQPTWRDRVGERSGRRSRGWFARLAGPAGAAVVATVVVAFVAVWLTSPRSTPGIVASPPSPSVTAVPSGSAAPTVRATQRPSASGLPALLLNGALPEPARVMVNAGDTYRVADLSTGTIGVPAIAQFSAMTTLIATPDGWACICGNTTKATGGVPSELELSLATIKPDGTPGTTTPIRTIQAELDPTVSRDTQSEIVDASAMGSIDGRTALVAWSARQGAEGWMAGIDVVDTATGSVLDSVGLRVKEPASANGRPTTRPAPHVTLSPTGDKVIISSFWYVGGESLAVPPSGSDYWMASFDGRTLTKPQSVGSTDSRRCGEAGAGLIDPTRFYVVCQAPDGGVAIDRLAVNGALIDETYILQSTGLELAWLYVRQGDRLFIWDPVGTRLWRFDLDTGMVDNTTGTAILPPTSPLDSLAALGRQVGRWLAPPVAAKVLVRPALVASPDGTRIYGLGVEGLIGDGSGGSRGIYAFDAATLAPIGHWTPTADLESIAISPDGRFVYAAAPSGVDATGALAQNAASITAYDTTDGSVRLLAGNLGGDSLFFPGPIAR